ncbi:MAG: hypothetical protein KKE04_03475, partial [Candidatus Thermoplasmatota archaeon]|nr:hypothetical protein [Candidatus Thermoplasmatota archaeon]
MSRWKDILIGRGMLKKDKMQKMKIKMPSKVTYANSSDKFVKLLARYEDKGFWNQENGNQCPTCRRGVYNGAFIDNNYHYCDNCKIRWLI